MTKKVVLSCICGAIVLLAVFGQYVHRGYVGVYGSGDDLVLLEHGFHLRLPWRSVTMYPVRCRDYHLEALADGPQGKVHADMVLSLSIALDKVIPLHRGYRGEYASRLISPLVTAYLAEYGEALGLRRKEYRKAEVRARLMEHLNSNLTEQGVNIYRIWLGSIEVTGPSREHMELEFWSVPSDS